MSKLIKPGLIIFFLFSFSLLAEADIIYLRNGRSMEGLITRENDQVVELNIGIGTVKFRRIEIESIYRSRPDEVSLIRNKWENHRQAEEEKRVKREQEIKEAMRKEELKPKEIEMSQAGPHIIVDALLNDKVRASLLLDTGASLILISRDIAKQLGIKTQGSERIEIMVTMADGREVKADYIVLESVNVQGAVARDIPAAVLSGKATVPEDGLLGMSFLDKFNFQIDSENKRLILQKRE